MKKVKILVSLGGVDFSFSANEEVEIQDELADSLINANQAELIEEAESTETESSQEPIVKSKKQARQNHNDDTGKGGKRSNKD